MDRNWDGNPGGEYLMETDSTVKIYLRDRFRQRINGFRKEFNGEGLGMVGSLAACDEKDLFNNLTVEQERERIL